MIRGGRVVHRRWVIRSSAKSLGRCRGFLTAMGAAELYDRAQLCDKPPVGTPRGLKPAARLNCRIAHGHIARLVVLRRVFFGVPTLLSNGFSFFCAFSGFSEATRIVWPLPHGRGTDLLLRFRLDISTFRRLAAAKPPSEGPIIMTPPFAFAKMGPPPTLSGDAPRGCRTCVHGLNRQHVVGYSLLSASPAPRWDRE